MTIAAIVSAIGTAVWLIANIAGLLLLNRGDRS
jgi:hypothetical protein